MAPKRKMAAQPDDAEDELIKVGKQLLSLHPKSKEPTLKLLKAAARILDGASQQAVEIKLASGDLCKALGKADLLKHKDRDVRLYTTACILAALKQHAPDNPFSDAGLDSVMRLLIAAFRQLEDPAAPHYGLCLSLLQTAAVLKCTLLMLDLDAADALQLELFSTVFEVINADNKDQVGKPALVVLAAMLDEGDDVPQQLLDCILGPLLPSGDGETPNPAAHHLAQQLLRRCQPTLQPHIQRFMTRLLEGERTDSELAGSSSDLVLQLYRAVPQIMLPVLPHLQPSLQVEAEDRRREAVDLICKLLSHPGAHAILADCPGLSDAVLRRLNDRSPDVRLRVLAHAKSLVDAFTADEALRSSVAKAVGLRLHDPDERLRSAAAEALCAIAQDHPGAVHSDEMKSLVLRFRDKRLQVRKDVAKAVAKLIKVWTLRGEDGSGPSGRKGLTVDLAMGLCALTLTRDVELAAYITDELFRGGLLSSKLSPAGAAEWWAYAWRTGGPNAKTTLSAVLRGKMELQRQVQELLRLRDAVREERAAGGERRLSLGGGGGGPSASSAAQGACPTQPTAAEQLETRLAALAAALPDLSRAEEGLQKLWAMKDNHIFNGLATLAAHGTPLSAAVAAAKEVQSRVSGRGPAAEVAAALGHRLSPTVVSPETLAAAIEAAADSHDAQTFVVDVAAAAPQMFSGLLPSLESLLEADDAMTAELAARVLAGAGAHMAAAGQEASLAMQARLQDVCLTGSPTGAKAAARALSRVLGVEAATPVLRGVCSKLLETLGQRSTYASHSRTLAALKAVSTAMRCVPALLSEFALDLFDCVVNKIHEEDMSSGRPLTPASKETGLEWGKPSPDVEIKAAALKTLAQALVLDDPAAAPDETSIEVAKTLIAYLGELSDTEPMEPVFKHFKWHLLKVEWIYTKRPAEPQRSGSGSGGSLKRKSPDEPHSAKAQTPTADGKYYKNEFSEQQRKDLEARTREVSPDAAWLRLAATSALLRLARVYDAQMTGNDYMGMGLSCQDPHPEVRGALIGKIEAGVKLYLGPRHSPPRAAKLAAIFALYSTDPTEHNVQLAYTKLRDYVVKRRAAVERAALKAAAAGDSGTLINQMPEFILPFLVFFMAHHPDYEEQMLFDDQGESLRAAAEGGGGRKPHPSRTEEVTKFFTRSLQMALEVLLLPAAGKGSAAAAAEVSRQAGASLKLLRQLKYCDVLGLGEARGAGEIDPGATACAHQICDIALALARQLKAMAMGDNLREVQKFPGAIALPRLCFRPMKGVGGSKRKDKSELPRTFHPIVDDLFSEMFSPGTPLLKKAQARTKNRDEVVEQRPAGRTKNGGAGGAAAPKRQRKQRPTKAVAAMPLESPVRQQPRRGAKDVAEEKLRHGASSDVEEEEAAAIGGGDGGSSDEMEWSTESEEAVAQRGAASQPPASADEDSPGHQENTGGLKLNTAQAVPHGKAARPGAGKKKAKSDVA